MAPIFMEGFSRDGTPSRGAQAWWDKTKLTLPTAPSTSTTTSSGSTTNTPASAQTVSDTAVAQLVTSGPLTSSALSSAVSGMGYVTTSNFDTVTATNVGTQGSSTRTAITSLVKGMLPTSTASTSSSGPRIYVESYRSAGVSDDQVVRAAIRAAAAYGATFEHPIVEFGPGPYTVTNGVFSDIGRNVQVGMTFVGQGYTTLKLATGGKADQWFYDNGVTTSSAGNDAGDKRRLAFAKWEGFNFTTDDPSRTNGNGFRFTGVLLGHEQNFQFDHCRFNAMDLVFQTNGNLNTDSIRLYDCYGYDVNTALVLNNNQALLMEWFGTAFELVRKDAFKILSGGGGDIKIYGGSWVLAKADGDTGKYAILNAAATDNTAWGNGNISFIGIRPELRDADSQYVYAPGPGGAVYVTFTDCNLYQGSTADRTMVTLGVNRRIAFVNSQINTGAKFLFDSSFGYITQNPLPPPMLTFDSCDVPEDLSGRISWTTGSDRARLGTAHGRRNKPLNITSGNAVTTAYLNDFDMNVMSGATRGVTGEGKVASFFPTGAYAWPDADTSNTKQEWNLILPPGAQVTKIIISRPALNSSTTAYQLAVTNGDKSTTYAATSSSGTYGAAVNLVQDVAITITTDPTDIKGRTLKLYAPKLGDSNAHAFGVGAAYVKYI